MVRIFDPSPVTTELYQLAEGPVWDAERERVLWVDIPAGRVHEAIFTGGTLTPTRQHDFPGQDMPGRYAPSTVGAVVPAQDGSLLVATRDALVVLAPSDRPRPVARDDITGRDREQRTQPAACARRALGGPILPSGKNSRFNDGACDPAGRFLIGSMALDGRRGQEVLYRLENDRSVTELDTDLSLSNGLCWSPDGTDFYSIDTTAGRVWARDYDPASGLTGGRREFLQLPDGSPDGICADAAGNLWIAIWGAGEVRCYSPAGAHVATVVVPVPHTTSVAFIGPRLDTLLITTAREGLSRADLEQFPDSGKLFAATVEVPGLASTPWRGSG